MKVWVSLNESASLVAWPRKLRLQVVIVLMAPSSMLSSGMPFAFQKVESPLELFLQFVKASGEIFINEYDLAAL